MKGLEALYMHSEHTILIECKQVCKDSDIIYEYCVTSNYIPRSKYFPSNFSFWQ